LLVSFAIMLLLNYLLVAMVVPRPAPRADIPYTLPTVECSRQ
jgi:hypothetical protein